MDEFKLEINDEEYKENIKNNEEKMKYDFDKENPYKNHENINFLELAKKLISEEKIHDAILALQAEVQKNEQSSEGWCLLGQLHAENDEDELAVACLLVFLCLF